MNATRIRSIATAAGLSVMPVAALAQTQRYDDWRHPGMMGGAGWAAMTFGPIFMLVSLLVLIAAVMLAVRWTSGAWRAGDRPPERTALDILKERFARGEIDKAEYEDRRRVLGE